MICERIDRNPGECQAMFTATLRVANWITGGAAAETNLLRT